MCCRIFGLVRRHGRRRLNHFPLVRRIAFLNRRLVGSLPTTARVVPVVQEVQGGRVKTGGYGVVEVDSFVCLEVISPTGNFLGISSDR